MVIRNRNKMKHKRGGWVRGTLRLTAMLIAAVLLLSVSAFAADTTNTQYGQTTYALVLTTAVGTTCTQQVDLKRQNATVEDCMEFFRIVYKDANGTTRSQYVFPDQASLQESLNWAQQAGADYVPEALTEEEQTQKTLLEQGLAALDAGDTDTFEENYEQATGDKVRGILIGGRFLNEIDWDQYRGWAEADLEKLQTKEDRYNQLEQQKNRTSTYSQFAAQMGYALQSANGQEPFQPYATDTYLFTPLVDISSIERIEFCTSGSGSWACQDIRLYRVDQIYGLSMYGTISNQKYIDFSGTLLADADINGTKTFNWSVDKLFQIGSGSAEGVTLNKPDEKSGQYATNTTQQIFRLDIADQYGAGVEALANAVKAGMTGSGFCEVGALEIEYQDLYGCTRLAQVPLMLSALGYAVEQGVSASEGLSGIMQQGETLALSASLPDLASLTSVTLVYGNKEAIAATGITYTGGKSGYSTRVSDLTTENAGSSDPKGDELILTNVAIYDASADVSVKLEDTMLRPEFSGSPVLYCMEEGGHSIKPGEEWTLKLKEYDGRVLGTANTEERYLIRLVTDDSALAATSGDVKMILDYRDLNGAYRSSSEITLSESVGDYYGYWPGVSEDFAYKAGMASGQELNIIVSLKNVDIFTNVRFKLDGSTDDWQLKEMEIYQLDELEPRAAAWENVQANGQTSDRRYYRTYTLLSSTPLLTMMQETLVTSGDYVDTVIQANSTVETREAEDWSDYRYSMSYETTQTLGDFTKARYNYQVTVKVAENTASSTVDSDSGSRNLFFFQLIFQNGKSGYVLANQQLTADGFRAGMEENFTIKMNQDYGELTAVRIIPEDPEDKTDLYDKLNVESIYVRKESSGATSCQWVIGDVGWIGIDFRDSGADQSTTAEDQGRAEDEFSLVYQVDYSTQVVNLLFEVDTGTYENSQQLVGQVYGTLKYYDGSGQLQDTSFDVVAAMYQYMGKKAVYPDSIGNTGNQNAISDPTLMFRANHKDRFILGVNDVSEVVSLTFKVKNTGSVPVIWNITSVSVSLVGSDSRLVINENEEYERIGATEAPTPLCSHTSTAEIPYSTLLPTNAEEDVKVGFTSNSIEIDKKTYNWTTSVAREPISANDTLNLYVYMAEGSDPLSDFTMEGAVQFSRVYSGIYQTSCDLIPDSSGTMLYALGLNAAGISSLNSLYLQSTPAWVDGQWIKDEYELSAPVDYAVIQQVRSGVVINTYYIDFAAVQTNNRGATGRPQASSESEAAFKQVLTLSFGAGTQTTDLISEKYDIAVSLRYTTTNDTNTGTAAAREYESPYVYLTDMTDKSWLSIQAGKVVDVVFHEAYVDQITGVNLVVTGNLSAAVDAACVATYDVDTQSGAEHLTGWFSFDDALTLENIAKTMECTTDRLDSDETVKLLTLSFTTADAEGTAESGTSGPVAMKVGYSGPYDSSTASTRVLPVFADLREHVSEGNDKFTTGTTVTTRFLLTGVGELKWIQLEPVSETGTQASWKLAGITGSLVAGESETLYNRGAIDTRINQGSPLMIDLSSITVGLSAKTSSAVSGTDTVMEVQNGEIGLLADSGQPVVITPTVTHSAAGYEVTAYEVDLTSGSKQDASAYLSQSGGTVTFTPPKNYSGVNVNYCVTVSSKEVPTVKSVVNITVKFEEKPAENVSVPGTTDPGTTNPETTNPETTDPETTDPGTTDPGTPDPSPEPPAE